MTQASFIQSKSRTSLPLVSADFDVDAEIAKFEREERERLGLDEVTPQWIERMADAQFTASERPGVTLLISGLTLAHDFFIEGALKGLGYNVGMLDCPDNEALRYGKEFGNRGQCNPTYFTVGNLVKFLSHLRDKKGMTTEDIVKKFVFVTAGACGPCRFGMYVTEYRKALRDAGFDGFRVVLFQQTGGFSQATGEDVGLKMDFDFFSSLTKAVLAGDVVNAIGYRLRPYEVEPGATDRAMQIAKQHVYDAFVEKKSVLFALLKGKKAFEAVKVDRTIVKPKASIIGEFWAMTTEGDGNYQLQRFLEKEGVEVDIQLVTAWLLYMLWEGQRDTRERKDLRGADKAMYGLAGLGSFGVFKREATLHLAEWLCRGIFQTFAHAGGLYGYKLPDMDEIAEIAHQHYHNDLRGGEGHMEVGKLIQNVVMSKAHMTVSVKPFGCMPSAGVSDGVQSLITEKYPGTIFCPVETSGDGAVNFYSRVQMYIFKAKSAAQAEMERLCQERGVTLDQVRAFLEKNPRYAAPLHRAPHAASGSAADLVAEVAPLITVPRHQRALMFAEKWAKTGARILRSSPQTIATTTARLGETAQRLSTMLAEDVKTLRAARLSG